MISESTRFLAAAAIAHVKRQYLEGNPDPEHMERRVAEYDKALAELAAPDAMPDDVRQAIRYCWRWALLHAETLTDEERYHFVHQEIDKVVLWLEEPFSIVDGWRPRDASRRHSLRDKPERR